MQPAFEILNPETGHRYKIYANGKIDGFDGSMVITNRIPAMILDFAWVAENYGNAKANLIASQTSGRMI